MKQRRCIEPKHILAKMSKSLAKKERKKLKRSKILVESELKGFYIGIK